VYERFFNLRERPFALSPDPDYLYRSRVHTEALSYLRYGIEGHAGFIVITGEIGSGKTTLLQAALRGVDKHTAVARLVNTQLDAKDLIEAVMLDFGLTPEPGLSKPRLLRVLAEYLVDQRVKGRLALLVIDEAQNLSLSALEEVRMLSNLETEKSKLVQIVLVGQPELRALLNKPELEQLRQRVTVSYHLPALDVDETAAYINHRLARAANGAPLEFPRDVSDVVHQFSRGVPRRINVIADAILLYAYGEGQRTIDVDLAQKAIDELKTSGILIEYPPATETLTPVPSAAAIAAGADSARETPGLASADIVARQERVLVSLQRLLAEQNHLIQEHREQLALLIARASRLPTTSASTATAGRTTTGTAAVPPASAVPGADAQRTMQHPAALPVRPAPAAPGAAPARAASSAATPTSAAWPPAASSRVVMPPEAAAENDGFWARLGRGFFNTFTPALKD
jgi:putative secretion ATPase (PEP-CTERM system associated)